MHSFIQDVGRSQKVRLFNLSEIVTIFIILDGKQVPFPHSTFLLLRSWWVLVCIDALLTTAFNISTHGSAQAIGVPEDGILVHQSQCVWDLGSPIRVGATATVSY